jgi:hypothetical protein
MNQKTCAACDYKLDDKAIKVTIGGKTVEVCCEECATKLKEAHSATASRPEVPTMSRWLWWLGPPLIAIALLLFFEHRPLAIEIASFVDSLSLKGLAAAG